MADPLETHLQLQRDNLWQVPEFYDYLKHLATLSTASLMLLATFATKWTDAAAKWTLVVAIACLLASTLLSAVSMLFVLSVRRYENQRAPTLEENLIGLFFIFAALTFMAGVIAVGVFAFINL
jgi:hypothetical protein